MPLNFFSSLINGAMNSVNTQLTNQSNERIAKEKMAWQQQENERAFQRDLQMWDMQNQYNSPAAQRERIEAAGGNAMLAFGNGVQATSGNASSAPSLKPAQAVMPSIQPYQGWNLGFSSTVQDYLNMKLLKGQLAMQDADLQSKKLDNEAKSISNKYLDDIKGYQRDGAREEVKGKIFENQFNEDTREFAFGIMQKELDLKAAELEIAKKTIEKMDNENDLLELDKYMKSILSDEKYIFWSQFGMPLLRLTLDGVGEYRHWKRR